MKICSSNENHPIGFSEVRVARMTSIYNLNTSGVETYTFPGGEHTLETFLDSIGGEDIFESPTYCQVNGLPILRDDWKTRTLIGGDNVVFVSLPADGGFLIGALIVGLLVSAVVLATIDIPTAADGRRSDPDQVFSLNNRSNSFRLGEATEVAYGRAPRHYPSYAASPYTEILDNDQYQFSLYFISKGKCDFKDLRLSETPISSFGDVETNIVFPGEETSLFPDNVVTSEEVSGFRLYGPNEPEFTGFTGPITISASGGTNRIDVDVFYSRGLGEANSSGDFDPVTVESLFEYRLVDNLGIPLGDGADTLYRRTVISVRERRNSRFLSFGPWIETSNVFDQFNHPHADQFQETIYTGGVDNTAFGADTRTIITYYILDTSGGGWKPLVSPTHTLATNTPQRFTFTTEFPPTLAPEGIFFEIRGRRLNDSPDDSRIQDELTWQTLRAYGPSRNFYGDCTLLEVKAKATNNLNDNTNRAFNGIPERYLPIWSPENGGEWSEDPVFTRNPIWAYIDVFVSDYGQALEDRRIDLEYLYQVAQQFDAEGRSFDFVFNDEASAWERGRTILSGALAQPSMNGPLISCFVDRPTLQPVAIFTPDNIVRDSFSVEYTSIELGASDGLEVEYIDENTRIQEVVPALIGEDQGESTEIISAYGITDRDRAFQYGMYVRSKQVLLNKFCTFTTGMEGSILGYGDLISVSSDLLRLTPHGIVTEVNGLILTLSEDFSDLTVTSQPVIVLRTRQGRSSPVFGVNLISESSQVELVSSQQDPNTSIFTPLVDVPQEVLDIDVTNVDSPQIYQLGQISRYSDLFRITNLESNVEEETIDVSATIYDEGIYANLTSAAPSATLGADYSATPIIPDQIANLVASQIPDSPTEVLVTWSPSRGATSYLVECSSSETNDIFVGKATTSDSFSRIPVSGGDTTIRVTPMGLSAGISSISTISVLLADTLLDPPENLNLTTAFRGKSASFSWSSAPSATSYIVEVWSDTPATGTLLRSSELLALSYSYSDIDLRDDSPMQKYREFTLRVRSKNVFTMSDPTDLPFSNGIPSVAPSGLTSILVSSDTDNLFYVSWDDISLEVQDHFSYIVVWSDTQGFDPSTLPNSSEVSDLFSYFTIPKNQSRYFRLASKDVWGDEVSPFSAELEVVSPA